MQKTYFLLLASLLMIASCKPKPQPEPQQQEEEQEEEQEETGNIVGTPTIAFKQLDIAIDGSAVLADGSIIAFGKSVYSSFRRVVKLSSTDGSVIWTKQLAGSDISGIHSIAAKPDGGYVLSGRHDVNNTLTATLLSFDKDGNQQWRRTFPSNLGTDQAVVVMADGGDMMIAAYRYISAAIGELTMIKVNSNGDELFSKKDTIQAQNSRIRMVRQKDRSYVLAYRSIVSGTNVGRLIRYDENGERTAQLPLTPTANDPYPEGVVAEKNELICFGTEFENSSARGFVARMSSLLTMIEKTAYSNDSMNLMLTDALAVGNDYMVTGKIYDGNDKSYPYIMKIKTDGTVVWKKVLNPTGDRQEQFLKILKLGNRQILLGNSMVAGQPGGEKAFIMDINENGDMVVP